MREGGFTGLADECGGEGFYERVSCTWAVKRKEACVGRVEKERFGSKWLNGFLLGELDGLFLS